MLILLGKAIREVQKSIQAGTEQRRAKLSPSSAEEHSRPEAQSCIQKQAQTALPLPEPEY